MFKYRVEKLKSNQSTQYDTVVNFLDPWHSQRSQPAPPSLPPSFCPPPPITHLCVRDCSLNKNQ